MQQVSLIGAGNMGGSMAANLLARGWTVEVCDIDPARVQSLVSKGALALPNLRKQLLIL